MKQKKILALVVVLVLLAAVAVAAAVGFRAKPLLKADQVYSLHLEDQGQVLQEAGLYLWPQGPDETYQSRTFVPLSQDQAEQILALLGEQQKRLSTEKLWQVPLQFFPTLYANVAAEMPPWLEAQLIVYPDTGDYQDVFNLVLGQGHAQQRLEHTFHPPCYTLLEEEAFYQQLSQIVGLPELLE